jgi:hypothetical protein
MTDPALKTSLYKIVRTELTNTHIPMIKKVADELETGIEEWYPRISALAAEVNVGDDAGMVEAMKEASAAMEKYEKVLRGVAPKLKEWKELLGKWSSSGGPAGI